MYVVTLVKYHNKSNIKKGSPYSGLQFKDTAHHVGEVSTQHDYRSLRQLITLYQHSCIMTTDTFQDMM